MMMLVSEHFNAELSRRKQLTSEVTKMSDKTKETSENKTAFAVGLNDMLTAIFHPIKSYKTSKDAREKAEIKCLEQSKKEASLILVKATKEMTDSRCPFENERCFEECIHFKKGRVYFQEGFGRYWDAGYRVVYPRCRLWKSI